MKKAQIKDLIKSGNVKKKSSKQLKTTHVYIDESICEKVNLATLTAVLIPEKKLKKITKEYYKIIKKILKKFPKSKNGSKIIYPPISLHGVSFLQNSKENKGLDFSNIDDDFRIEILNDVLDIVASNRLIIIRLGYNNYNAIKSRFKGDNMLYGLNWLNLSNYIDKYTKIGKALCIMEGSNSGMIDKLSGQLLFARSHHYLHPEIAKSLVLKDIRKFIGNVYYSPAKYCEYLQITDVVAYILHKRDYIDIIGNKSEYGGKLYDLYEKINKKRLINFVTSSKEVKKV